MKLLYWLKDFVDVTAPPQDLASRLALFRHEHRRNRKRPARRSDGRRSQFNRPTARPSGIAREVAASTSNTWVFHVSRPEESPSAKASDAVKGRNSSANSAAASGASFETSKIQPSPKWLKDRLEPPASPASARRRRFEYVMVGLWGGTRCTRDYDKSADHNRRPPREATRKENPRWSRAAARA